MAKAKPFLFQLLIWFAVQTARAQQCSCTVVFDSLTQHLSKNYPGFEIATGKSNWSAWHLAQRIAVKDTRTPKDCAEHLQKFLQFFGDGHLGVVFKGDVYKREKSPKHQPAWPELSEPLARRYLDSSAGQDSLEGIWESYEGLYKVFVKRDALSGVYTGYILETINQNWVSGEIKMEFKPVTDGTLRLHYYMSSHKVEKHAFTLDRNILEIKGRTVFQRVYPRPANPIALESFVSGNYGVTEHFVQWDKSTFYIQLQNISAGNKPLIDSLLRVNYKAIVSSPNLILDLRDNEGGDFTCFDNLWPLIIKDTLIVHGTTYRCTRANVAAFKAQVEHIGGDHVPQFGQFVQEMETHIGQDWSVPDDTILIETTTAKPEKVVLLVNGKCKSSTENFILSAMRSPKVLVAGESTGGVVDYEEVVDVVLPCPHLTLQMPIGRSNRLPAWPLNGIGLKPTILLKPGSQARQPWIKQVVRRLRR